MSKNYQTLLCMLKIKNKIQTIAMILVLLITYSCNFLEKRTHVIKLEEREMVTIYDYQIHYSNLENKDLRDSTVTYTDTIYLYGRMNTTFAINDSIGLAYSYAIEKDSFFLENIYCPNLDTIYLRYKNEMVEIVKSNYDVERSIDEEMYVYWNHDYGLIALYNYPWRALILFDKEKMGGFAKELFYNNLINTNQLDF